MKRLAAFAALFLSLAVSAADMPYDEAADAKADIRAALADAKKANVPVLVVFGANWCGDCKMLDRAFKSGRNAQFARDFRIVKVDVARFTKNVDVAEAYGVPLKKGIPAVAVLGPDGQVRYATKAGELADARKMGEDGIYEFFRGVSAKKD